MKNVLKALTLAIMLVLLVPCTIQAQTGKANFSGDWAYNAQENSGGGQMGGGRGFGGGDMSVKQDANLLTVAITRQGRDGGAPVTTTMKYTLDGKEAVNSSQWGDSKSTATWSADGKSLTIKTARTIDMGGESREVNSTEVWNMNATALNVTSTMQTPDGERTSTRVYQKK
jgi:hypothetical protein